MTENRGSNSNSGNGSAAPSGIGSWTDFAKLFITPFLIAAAAIGMFFLFTFFFTDSKDRYDYLESIKIGGPSSRWHAAFMLSGIIRSDQGKPVEDRFLAELLSIYKNAKNDDPRIRRYLTLALGHLKDPRSAQSLREATNDADDETRLYALWSLGKLGYPEVHREVVPFLSDPDPGMRKLAAHLLGSMRSEETLNGLRLALSDPVDDVKWNAALSLAKLGDGSGIEVLSLMLDREYLGKHQSMDDLLKENTIRSALIAVGNLNARSLKERLEVIRASDPSMKVRQAAIEALEMFDGNG